MKALLKRGINKGLDLLAARLAERLPASAQPRPQPLAVAKDTTHFYFHTSDGHRFFLDAKDLHITLHVLEHGHWEDHVRDALMRILKPGDTFIDVGGNVGLHALFAGSIVGNKGQVYAFEPLPHMFHTLKTNAEINGMQQIVEVHKLAVSDHNGAAKFSNLRSRSAMSAFDIAGERLDGFNDSDSSDVEVIDVNTVTLDSFFADKQAHGIKIDVEGYETLVLRGARELIRRSPDIKVIIEWHPYFIEKATGAGSIAECVAFFEKEGFKAHLAIWQKPLRAIDLKDLHTTSGDIVLSRQSIL